MKISSINLDQAFGSFDDYWAPRVGGDVNEFQIKLAKFKGEFHWHHHENEDELFLVIRGVLLMKLRPENGGDQTVRQGEYIIIPKGIEHCPTAVSDEVHCVLLEPKSTLNTGNVVTDRTLRNLQRVG
jgi:mannose-6-phosphate isomerase-like protein (cupin superfamily)